jgi:hypothetical protein
MIEHTVTVNVDGQRIVANDVHTRGEAVDFITRAIDTLAPDTDGISFFVEKSAQLTDHEHCEDAGTCWQNREPCPAGAQLP